MKIAVIGTGRVGSALGRRLAEAGNEVVFGSRDPGSDRVQQLLQQLQSESNDQPARAAGWSEAIAFGEVVILSVPWNAARQAVAAGRWDGKVLVDCINPVKPDLSGLDLDGAASAAESLAQWAPGAKVVKAFNSVSSATMADPRYDSLPATLFYCGDDTKAKETVSQLGQQLGFEPVDAGPLSHAGYLESLAMLYIHLAMHGWGSNCAFKILKRETPR